MQSTRYSVAFALIATVISPLPLPGQQAPSAAPLRPVPISNLEAVMLRVTRQVQIEAKVVEVELRDEFSAGIDWRSVLGGLTPTARPSPTAAPVSSGGMTLTLNVTDFSALLEALAAQGT